MEVKDIWKFKDGAAVYRIIDIMEHRKDIGEK